MMRYYFSYRIDTTEEKRTKRQQSLMSFYLFKNTQKNQDTIQIMIMNEDFEYSKELLNYLSNVKNHAQ
jgi:hypothetical protein